MTRQVLDTRRTNVYTIGHIALAVTDVDGALAAVRARAGGSIGDVVAAEIAGAGRLRFVYATGPEGNVIELQEWSSRPARPVGCFS